MSNIRISELEQVAAAKLLIDGVFPFSQKNVSNNDELTTYKATFQQLLDLLTTLNSSTYILPPGLIMPYGGTEAAFNLIKPSNGWKICNGAQISIVDYSALFAVIGTTYGGATVDKALFRLPDLRGRTLIGAGQGTGLGNYLLGMQGGVEDVALVLPQIPSHTHTVSVPNMVNNEVTASSANVLNHTGPSGSETKTSSSAGNGNSHNNMQPYTVINYIIKT